MASFFGIGRAKQKSAPELARETKELTVRLAQERLGPDDKPSPKVCTCGQRRDGHLLTARR